MLAALSPEAQVNTILDEIGCAPTNFTDIADRHANSRVLAALKGTNDFDPADGEYYLGLARQMKRLAEEYPVPIDWRKILQIKQILAARKTQARPVPFTVVFIGQELFKQIVAGKIETTTDYKTCAAFKDGLVAHAAARILNENMGQFPVRYTQITNEHRPAESISDKLADVGFEQ